MEFSEPVEHDIALDEIAAAYVAPHRATVPYHRPE
jgi:hypothetical protein